jgi:hypothetical protein
MSREQPTQARSRRIAADFQHLNEGATLEQEIKFVGEKYRQSLQLEYLKTLRANNRTLKQNNKQRKIFSAQIFVFSCVWVLIILLILLLQGFGGYWWGNRRYAFGLSEPVLVTMITTTTINCLSFFVLVVKYLFRLPSVVDIPAPPD